MPKRALVTVFGALLVAGVTRAQAPSPYRLRADAQFLASSALEGRALGSRGALLAAEYVRSQFAQLGAETSLQPLPIGSLQGQNVVATIPGSERGVESVLITAPVLPAPDNASGVVVLLEIARLWAALEPRPLRTVVFVAMAPGDPALAAFAAKPPRALNSVRMHLDLPSFAPGARTHDFVLQTPDESPMWVLLRQSLERLGMKVSRSAPDAAPSITGLAKMLGELNVPSFALIPAGASPLQNAAGGGRPIPSDPSTWDMARAEQMVRYGLQLGLAAANLPRPK